MSGGPRGSSDEQDELFALDEAVDDRFPDEYDGNDIGEGEFLLHLVPRRDAEDLLKDVLRLIPSHLLQVGSYAVVRLSDRDEMTERVIPLAGEPALPPKEELRAPLSFGMVSGGDAADNKPLLDYITEVWRELRATPKVSSEVAQLIVIWYVGGDVSSPDQARETVRIENRSERMLGAGIEIPYRKFSPEECGALVHESLERAIDEAERLVQRRKLGWNLDAARRAAAGLRK
jgi:hypothetical protein